LYNHTIEQFKKIDYVIPLFETLAWSGFTNQPAGDKIEVLSNDVGDTQKCIIFGTDNTTGALIYEAATLTGTTAVATIKADWGNMLGAFLGDINGKNVTPATGTITFREASAGLTITTIAAAKASTGLVGFNLQGSMISVQRASGNLYIYPAIAATVENGILVDSSTLLNLTIEDLLTLISDGSGATSKIIVWK